MTEKHLYMLIGIDTDYPRGDWFFSEQGMTEADKTLMAIEIYSKELTRLDIPFTFFVCGLFLENMVSRYGKQRVVDAFQPKHHSVEIADHTYSHRPLREIPTRRDKSVISSEEISGEYTKNTQLFLDVFNIDIPNRGFRTPLGHYGGLTGLESIQNILLQSGVTYVSADLRDQNHSIHPRLRSDNGKARYPYRYPNGLLEIPAHGWQDTAFFGFSKTVFLEPFPNSYDEIIHYYKALIRDALLLVESEQHDFFLGLTLHPFNLFHYGKEGQFIRDLHEMVLECEGIFCQYGQVSQIIREEY